MTQIERAEKKKGEGYRNEIVQEKKKSRRGKLM